MDERNKRGFSVQQMLAPVLTASTPLLLGLLTFLTTQQNSKFDQYIRTQEANRASQTISLKDRESLETYRLKVWEEVIEALEKPDEKHRLAVIALVGTVENKDLAAGWIDAIKSVAISDKTRIAAQETAKVIQFKKDEETVLDKLNVRGIQNTGNNRPARWKNYRYDIFWCEENGTATLPEAQQVEQSLKASGVEGKIRVRMLPESVNRDSDYGVKRNEIRYYNDESDIADNAIKALKAKNPNIEYDKRLTFTPTPGYISLFLCSPKTAMIPER